MLKTCGKRPFLPTLLLSVMWKSLLAMLKSLWKELITFKIYLIILKFLKIWDC